MTEVWRDVPGYEGLYVVSDAGNVRNVETGLVLKAAYRADSAARVVLYRDRKPARQPVAQLVLEVFKGPCPEGAEARHRDHDLTNNRLDNLFWGTQDGEANPYARLTNEQVRSIRTGLTQGVPPRVFVSQFGVTRQTISAIKTGKRWAGVP
jgi:hypothetical protein